jgi:hypothetical protein
MAHDLAIRFPVGRGNYPTVARFRSVDAIVGMSPVGQSVMDRVEQVASTNGESRGQSERRGCSGKAQHAAIQDREARD